MTTDLAPTTSQDCPTHAPDFLSTGREEAAWVADPHDEPVRDGYGRCSVCTCPGYMGNGELCGNCGHNYGMHW